jgi:hypothetical protein
VRRERNLTVAGFAYFSALLLAGCGGSSTSPSPPPPATGQAGHLAGYDVGVDYHAFGSDFESTAFITIYDQPGVRDTVQAQLQGMANEGATFVHTSVWLVTEPGGTNLGQTWRATFPITAHEAANLRTYAQDVAAVRSSSGNRLRLTISLKWLGAADYTQGSPSTGLGSTPVSAAEFTSRVQATTDSVLAAVSDVTRPDGVKLVDTIYMGSGVRVGSTPNEEWFLTANYPRFVATVSKSGIKPSLYFGSDFSQADVLDDTYTDSAYPVLNGHRSMFWLYRSLIFMVNQGLPLPSRIDFSCYMMSTGATYDALLQRILGDADATLPSLGAPRAYGVTETYYFTDPTQRLQFGQAYAVQAAENPALQRVSFWTTPNGGGTGQNEAYPFTIEDFLPQPP